MYPRENNPHFLTPQERQPREDHFEPQGSHVSRPHPQGHPFYPQSPAVTPPGRGDRHYQPSRSRVRFEEEPQYKPDVPLVVPPPRQEIQPHDQHLEPHAAPSALQPQPQGQGHGHPHARPHRHQRASGPRVPTPQKTKAHTWLFAVICVIFWLVIIVGGLIVLIVYLLFRPRIPQFSVSSATMNAAYLDMGSLLNADFTLLANFTNPNKKVLVDFSYVTLNMYYGSTLIATQYIEPFSATNGSRLAYVHMVTSQVRLPFLEIERLKKQMEANGVVLYVKGVFRARSNLGSILRYSYWLYGHCSMMVTRPPDGVSTSINCRTKR